MTRPIASPLARAAVVVLVLAVMLCLVLPMAGGDGGMQLAMFCCFVLAVALTVFLLGRPREIFLLGDTFGSAVPLARGPTQTARAPDVVVLGALLI